MRTRVDDLLRAEAARYRLAFSCDRCAQFDAETRLCALEYPTEPHRDAGLEGRDEVVFCKLFELG